VTLFLEVLQQALVVDVEAQRSRGRVQVGPVDKQSHALIRLKSVKHGRCPRISMIAQSHVDSWRWNMADGLRRFRPSQFPKQEPTQDVPTQFMTELTNA